MCYELHLFSSKKRTGRAWQPAITSQVDSELGLGGATTDVSDWDVAEVVAKDKVDSFKKLEDWFKARKAELKKDKGKPRDSR